MGLDGISKQSVKTSEAARSGREQENKNSGARVPAPTVDTRTNEGSKTMGRGFLSCNAFFPLAARDVKRQEALCFPMFSLRRV